MIALRAVKRGFQKTMFFQKWNISTSASQTGQRLEVSGSLELSQIDEETPEIGSVLAYKEVLFCDFVKTAYK